jgi:creatinine amidohydrolase
VKKKKNLEKVMMFEELSWKQIEKLDKEKTVFFLPISPMEEHGPHLPVGTDFLIVKNATIDAIKILNKKHSDYSFIMMPLIPIGFCEFNTDFPGSISVTSKIVRDVVYSYGASLAEHGFKYLVICTYHMALSHLKGIYSAMNKLRSKYNMGVYEPWAPFFYSGQIEKNEPKLGFDTSKEVHACFRETSLMKYQYPYLVDESYKNLQSIYRDLSPPRLIGKKFKEIGLSEGYIGSPARADADYGRWFFNQTVQTFVKSTDALIKGEKIPDLPSKIKKNMNLLFWQ